MAKDRTDLDHELESGKMPEIQLGAPTVRSHGAKVARTHLHDWLILILLIVIDGVLNIIEPFHRFVGQDMLTDLSYPFKDNTIPFWAVPMIAVILPFCVVLAFYFVRNNVFDLHHALLGLLFSVLITGVLTDAIKDAVGRPRPDFFWRCFPDGKGVFDPVTKGVQCTGLKSVIKEGHKSFPSGHTSCFIMNVDGVDYPRRGLIHLYHQQFLFIFTVCEYFPSGSKFASISTIRRGIHRYFNMNIVKFSTTILWVITLIN